MQNKCAALYESSRKANKKSDDEKGALDANICLFYIANISHESVCFFSPMLCYNCKQYTFQCSVPTNKQVDEIQRKKRHFLTNRFVVFVVVSKRDESFFFSLFEINIYFFFLSKRVKHNIHTQ